LRFPSTISDTSPCCFTLCLNAPSTTNIHTLSLHDALPIYNAHQVKWISGRDGDEFGGCFLTARGTQRFHGHRQSELLSQEIADEAAPPNFAAIFQPAQRDEQLAPFGKNRFARQKLAKDDAVAAQQHPANGFERTGAVVDLAGIEQRPAARAVPRT